VLRASSSGEGGDEEKHIEDDEGESIMERWVWGVYIIFRQRENKESLGTVCLQVFALFAHPEQEGCPNVLEVIFALHFLCK